jgi:trk system potassium uptake protein
VRVIVVGCGRVGSELAVRLQRDGHDVALIDKVARSFRRLPEDWPGERIIGFGFDRDVLEQAGVHQASALAAVTSGDNTNILTARIARETFELPYVVARIYDPRRAVIYQRLGIPTVATVSWTVDQVLRRLLPEDAVTAWTDPTGEISLVEHLLPDALCGRKLSELVDGGRYRPVLVTRAGQARLLEEGTVGQEGDVVHFAVRTDAAGALDERLAIARRPVGEPAASGTRR